MTVVLPSNKLHRMIFNVVNRLSRCVCGVTATAVRDFFRLRSFETGAGIAFFTFFSLFPLIIFLISILGYILDMDRIQSEVLKLMEEVLPVSESDFTQLIEQNLRVLIDRRGSISILAAVGFLWAGSNMFAVLARYINLAWHTAARPHGFVKGRLVSFSIIFVLAVLIIFSLMSTTALNVLSRFNVPFREGVAISETPFWDFLTNLIPNLFGFVLFLVLYYWVPNTKVRWPEAIGGALVATVLLRLAINAFKWVVKEGILNYKVVYGSLAAVVMAMFWIYISIMILMFGAHLCAAIAQYRNRGREIYIAQDKS